MEERRAREEANRLEIEDRRDAQRREEMEILRSLVQGAGARRAQSAR